MIEIITGIIGMGIGSFLIWKYLKKQMTLLEEKVKKAQSETRSAYVKFGKSFEHFVPFTKNYPGNKEKSVFLGMPIDFISFDEDTIKFIEVKTGSSSLNQNQSRIKKQIENNQIEFKEVRY